MLSVAGFRTFHLCRMVLDGMHRDRDTIPTDGPNVDFRTCSLHNDSHFANGLTTSSQPARLLLTASLFCKEAYITHQ